MSLEEAMETTRESLQNSLDELISPRSSSKSKMQALQTIEIHLATACFSTEKDSLAKDVFIALQHTFECNIPSKLLPWLLISTSRLEALTIKGISDDDSSEVEQIVSQISLALSLIQGVALIHMPSKQYLGRRCALEILLEVFLTSRHVPSAIDADPKSKSSGSPHLTSITLDTLLCILVDSTKALRSFEEANGIQSVVKILKRAGTPREVRMKCLEFLYFYLLDETPQADDVNLMHSTLPPTAPATPIRPLKPYLSNTPMHPTSRYGSSTYSFSSSTTDMSTSTSSVSSRSTSGSSFCSTSSNASSSTAASSLPTSPAKDSFPAAVSKPSGISPPKRVLTPYNSHRSPTSSPPFSSAAKFPQLRSMMMLRKDVDYIPQSPKKGGFNARSSHRKSLSTSTISSYSRSRSQLSLSESKQDIEARVLSIMDTNVVSPTPQNSDVNIAQTLQGSDKTGQSDKPKWKTTEEKKELLGTMLGNVDALVEGVRKAGIWGLG